jgi:glutathione S-transferase
MLSLPDPPCTYAIPTRAGAPWSLAIIEYLEELHPQPPMLGSTPLVDARLGAAPFVCGERPTIADCTLWAPLGSARFGEVEIPAHHRHLARWRDRFSGRPGGSV